MTEYTTTERQTVIDAPASAIVPHIADFTKWVDWSPWEGADSALKRTYGGTQGEAGASYAWDGNRKAGAGDMTVVGVKPDVVDIDLHFTRPFDTQSTTAFRLVPAAGTDGSTTVVWTMRSPKTVMSRIMGLFMNFDKMVGGDFEKGLARLKTVVEG